jgi:phosphate transport system substrate-binding protein
LAVTGHRRLAGAFLLVVVTAASCTLRENAKVTGNVRIGSTSTVDALSTRLGRAFLDAGNTTDIRVTSLGAGAAVRALCAGHLDLVGLDRSVTTAEHRACGGRMTARVPAANDAITVIVNRGLHVSCLQRSQLRRWWAPSSDGTLTTWRQLDPAYPDVTMELFGPGPASGTYASFVHSIERGRGDIRHDYTVADERVVVAGVAALRGAGGIVSYPSFVRARHRVAAVRLDAGAGCVAPSPQTVRDGSYLLSRPLYLYVSARSWRTNAAVRALVRYFVDHADDLGAGVDYIPLTPAQQAAARRAVDALG